MEASEAAEIIRGAAENQAAEHSQLQFNRVAALLTAMLAALLAVATIGTGVATRAQLNTNIHVADIRSTTDVASLRQHQDQVAVDTLQSQLDASNASAGARSTIMQRISAYQSDASHLDGDARAGTGIKGGEAQVSTLEQQESSTETRILSFEYSEVGLQIAIVLTSVAILTERRRLFYTCCGLGVVSALLMFNGFTLISSLPAFH